MNNNLGDDSTESMILIIDQCPLEMLWLVHCILVFVWVFMVNMHFVRSVGMHLLRLLVHNTLIHSCAGVVLSLYNQGMNIIYHHSP